MTKPKSAIIYNGPSLIDNQPIIVVAIISSNNIKTGNMIQTHIIRSDINPLEASKTGKDYSICGDCMHRGKPSTDPAKKTAQGRTCYVNIGQGPNQVFKAYKAGKYPSASPEEITAIGNGRMVRLGTYGDPAAVPASIWNALLKNAQGHTGYTHQHNAQQTPDYSRMMYSADNASEAQQAHSKGYRTFRVIPVQAYKEHGQNSILANEILCPASKEAGQKVTCNNCKLCTGSNTKAKSIAIVAHGTSRNFVQG
ncbi:MAG: hypothetical protein EAZ74_07105 [Alphaproteobacteria bacterium]|nr:MAG: hypothetical protein EAZ74_07105 [Alphaproteobacteria bacterium]